MEYGWGDVCVRGGGCGWCGGAVELYCVSTGLPGSPSDRVSKMKLSGTLSPCQCSSYVLARILSRYNVRGQIRCRRTIQYNVRGQTRVW